MLKIIILSICLFLITGCDSVSVGTINVNDTLSRVLSQDNHLYNVYEIGYRYYLPRNFNEVEKKDNNHVLISEGVKYYMYVDLVAFYNDISSKYVKDENAYYSEDFRYNDIDGYLEVVKKDSYFYIKMMYNYAIIEVRVNESDVKDAIIYSGIMLSSIDFNRNVIESMVGEDLLSGNTKLFELVGPKEEVNEETYLDYIEKYDNYEQEEIEIIDPDFIN